MSKSAPESTQLTSAELLAFGQPHTAAQKLQNILQRQPDNLEARLELIRQHLFLGNYEQARQEAQTAKHRWPGEKRLDGFLACAERAERKHLSKSRRTETSGPRKVFTSEKAFHLIRFVFCLLVSALAFAVFFYYFFYLDSSSHVNPRTGRIIIPPLGTLVLYAAFFFILLSILYQGFRNLFHFLFLPDAVAVSQDGLLLKGKFLSVQLSWPEIASVILVEQAHWKRKENHWVYDQWVEIQGSRKATPFSPKYFLTRIPQSCFGQFYDMVSTLKDFTQVRCEKRGAAPR